MCKTQDWPLVGKTRKLRDSNEENRLGWKSFIRWKGSFVIFKTAGAYVQDSNWREALLTRLHAACSDWRQRLTWRRQGRGPRRELGSRVYGGPITNRERVRDQHHSDQIQWCTSPTREGVAAVTLETGDVRWSRGRSSPVTTKRERPATICNAERCYTRLRTQRT
jgi:hypothetical protein